MQFSKFRSLFEGSIRSSLSWDLLERYRPEINDHVITERSAIGKLLTVWYRNAFKYPSVYQDAGARQQTVAEASSRELPAWPAGRASNICKIRAACEQSSEPTVILAPCYQTAYGLLVLDGTHRIVGSYLSGKETRILALTLCAPDDKKYLPDLCSSKRWTNQ